MVRVFIAGDPFEAHFVKDYLNAAGFEARVHGEHLYHIRGGVPLTEDTLPSVWLVHEEDAPGARDLIARLQARRNFHGV